VQHAILPQELPKVPGYDFHARYLPAEKVGGDFYDVIKVDNEHLGILMADVSGHGVPAAFIMTMAKMSFAAHAPGQLSTVSVLEQINKGLIGVIPSMFYLTAFYMVLHVPSGRFTYTRASHPTPFHYSRSTKRITTLDTKGMLVGMLESPAYSAAEGVLEPGDRILIFTDGLNETLNPDKKQYGMSKISASVLCAADGAPEGMADRILNDVKAYKRGLAFEDDVALLVIGRVQTA
jgi:phosphoserine phosphatase RsbU/P